MNSEFLNPTSLETFHLQDSSVEVPKAIISFKEWHGAKPNSFGGKPFIDFDGVPIFAELAIARTFQQLGYTAYWVETYARGNKPPMFLLDWQNRPYKEQTNCDIDEPWILEKLTVIAQQNHNTYDGCWDVLAWKGEELLFIESKRNKKDSVRSSQNNWLQAALQTGLKPKNFLIVQWNFLIPPIS
ncbi:hypothetical protein HYV70_05545 [Candidatus Uhrbacteria bacterium]|nr:hypothetical protein [Candidatus Uhrbacteria bacterium]